VFLDEWELRPGELIATGLSEGLEGSRFLVLVLSASSVQRDWVRVEWNAFFSHHGPRRLIPVKIDSVAPPAILAPFQAIDALDRDVARAAREIAAVAGRLEDLPPDDARRLFIGQELFFTLQEVPNDQEASADDRPSLRGGEEIHVGESLRDSQPVSERPAHVTTLRVIGPAGQARDVVPPWRQDNRFGVAHFGFGQLAQAPIESDADRADLTRHATTLGCALFDLLFDPPARDHLRSAVSAGLETRAEQRSPNPMPFAWSQLVFYHRGPDYPLGAAVRKDQQIKPALRRTFLDAGDRRILVTGFIGRRTDMHRVRRKIREGQRVFVFQGLGGLGKSTLALEVLKLLGGREDACVFWCQDT